MSSLKDLIKDAEQNEHKIVTAPHYDWKERLEHEQVPSQKALHHVIRVLLRQHKHPRKGRFSPSSMGECARKIIFSYAGAPERQSDVDNQEMMDHGSFGHLKWQIEGLTMGYMNEAEVWVYDKDLMCGGSMDAVLHDESIFELKTAALGVYNRIVVDHREPKFENMLQFATYALLFGASWGSVVYENRGVGLFHEFRVEMTSKLEREVLRRLKSYKRYVEDDQLPPQLSDCEQRIGKTYRQCPFREICHVPKKISDVDSLHPAESKIIPVIETRPEWAENLLRYLERAEAVDGWDNDPDWGALL